MHTLQWCLFELLEGTSLAESIFMLFNLAAVSPLSASLPESVCYRVLSA